MFTKESCIELMDFTIYMCYIYSRASQIRMQFLSFVNYVHSMAVLFYSYSEIFLGTLQVVHKRNTIYRNCENCETVKI